MTYLVSHPGLARQALGQLDEIWKMRGAKGPPPSYAQAVSEARKPSKLMGGTGRSIAEKRAAIAAQLVEMTNSRRLAGTDTSLIEAVEEKFERAYTKATSGYLTGGMWDGFWRYSKMQGKWWPHYLVAHQLDQHDIEQLTPSARRFSEILDHLSQALMQGEEAMQTYHRLTKQVAEAFAEKVGDDKPHWERQQRFIANIREFVVGAKQHRDAAHAAIGRANGQVWPDKKHYARRLAISAALYSAAVIVGVVALAISSPVVAAIGFAVTLILRIVGLVNIRGYDRERSWKSVESLLDATEKLINGEGETMKVGLWKMQEDAAALQRQMMWDSQQQTRESQQRMREDIGDALRKLSELKQDVSRIAQAVNVPTTSSGNASSSAGSSSASSAQSTPQGTPPKDRPAPLVRAQSCGYFTFDGTRFA